VGPDGRPQAQSADGAHFGRSTNFSDLMGTRRA
jgi:hypothetical protein